MKVKDAIEILKGLNPNSEMYYLYGGELRGSVDYIYEGKTGLCVVSEVGEVAYSDEARPPLAPSKEEDNYWKVGG